MQDAAGTTRLSTAAHTRNLESIFGTLELTRTAYRVENTPSLHPLTMRLTSGQRSTRWKCGVDSPWKAARAPLTRQDTGGVHRAHVPKQQFEGRVIRAAQDFEAVTPSRRRRARADPHTGAVLVLAVDGKDFIHVVQHFWEAAQALIPEDQAEQDRWIRAHLLLEMLRGKTSLVAAGIGRTATLRAMAAAERQAVEAGADYFLNYAPISTTIRRWLMACR